MTLEVPVIDKLLFLFDPHRYKVIYGGRGGVKSWTVAQALLVLGLEKPLRIVCGRETQSSIRESVHQLLDDRIGSLGLRDAYEVMQYTIRSKKTWPDGRFTEFIFTGLRPKEIRNIKSLEGADILWIEEAAGITNESWNVIVPTIRKPGSEIWITFNPETEEDCVYKQFVVNQHPAAQVVRTYYYENPWLPDTMRIEMEHMRVTDPGSFQHVWLGECLSTLSGAIYEAEMEAATRDGRITNVPADRTKPVDTFWDLGFGDDTAIWLGQAYGGYYNLVDFISGHGKTIEHYLILLQQRGYVYGADWLPHDGVDSIIHHKLAGGDRSRSIEMLMRAAGRTVRVCPKLEIADRINAGRTVFPQCRFDSEKCRDGIKALRSYQWGPPIKVGKELVQRTKPLHNWASHPSDAFQTMAVASREAERPAYQPPKPSPRLSVWN